ncbi:hypothetical protein ACKFKF_14150 [Phormidesmis sp. 146-12]
MALRSHPMQCRIIDLPPFSTPKLSQLTVLLRDDERTINEARRLFPLLQQHC